VALVRVLDSVEAVVKRFADKKMADEEVGADIIARALRAPLRQIAENAGLEGSVVVEEVRKKSGAVGYNAAKDKYEDLIKIGIIDPVKVTRSALQNASSAAGMLLTTEAVIVDLPEAKSDESAGGGGMPGGVGMM